MPAVSQSDVITWSRPANLSNTPQASAHPAIITDGYGYVHVFWSEEVGAEPLRPGEGIGGTGNTIIYTRWDGAIWIPPMDILFVPGETLAEFPAVDVDADSRLHLVWMATNSLYYSSALSWVADSAHSWSEPMVLADYGATAASGASVATDLSGGVHVIYAANGDGAGIYYLRSTDGGMTWGTPIALSEPFATPEGWFSVVRIVRGNSGCLHAVWQTNQAEGFGQAVYYARSTDTGDTWGRSVQLGWRDPEDFEVAWPYLTTVGESELHLIYVDGAGIGSIGRFHRISKDGGETWSTPYHILTDMVGVNGYVLPIVDGAGQMHLMIDMRTKDTQTVGIYYARWLRDSWSPVEPVDIYSPGAPSAHYTAAAIRRGNELHVVYTQHTGGEIWHVYGLIPSVGPKPALALPSSRAPIPWLEATETVSQAPTSLPKATTQPTDGSAPLLPSRAASHPLVPAVGITFLLVTAAVVGTRIRSR